MELLQKKLNFSPIDDTVNFHFYNGDFISHSHLDYYEIVIIANGQGTHTVNGISTFAETGDTWLILPKDVHSLTSDSNNPCQHLNISISNDFMHILCNAIDNTFFTQLNTHTSALKIKIPQQMFKRILSIIYKYQSMYSQNISKKNGLLNCIAQLIIQEFYINSNEQSFQLPNWLVDLLEKISSTENLEMKPSDILKTIPYSYSHFERLFKKYMNISFVDYLNINKINYAKELLKTTDIPIIAISNKIGMQSLSYFYNIFKRQTGYAPSQFKKRFAYNKISKN